MNPQLLKEMTENIAELGQVGNEKSDDIAAKICLFHCGQEFESREVDKHESTH